MTGKRKRRAGYALIMVLVFMVLFVSIVGVAFRRLGSAVRLESAHTNQVRRDGGSVVALSRAMALLETGLPPTDPYVCGTVVDTPAGTRNFTVTFTLEEGTTFSVRAAPTPAEDNPSPMPDTFFSSAP